MFDLCPLVNNRQCAFAAKYKGNLHCGLISCALEGNKVKNLPKCPKTMSKYEKTKHGRLF